jgi:hypothetical protein
MPQISKVLTSREEWKSKAVERATDLREYRKTEKRHLKKIAELKRQCFQSELIIEEKKTLFPSMSKP